MNRMARTMLLLTGLALAAMAAPPAPEAFFGHRMGADRSVLDWPKVTGYFAELARESDRVKVEEFGKSTEGRPMIVAYISAPETVKRLEHYRQIQKRLADPRMTGAEEAARLAGEGKSIVLITCSVHSTEVASTHTAIEFAWKLATANDARTRQILDNVIVLLAPTINPDGLDLVTRWYRKTLGTPFEGTAPPELYQKYVGHDNNRDWYIFTQAETRAVVEKLHNGWHPQIVYDVHQMGATSARMFVPPYMDPIEPNVDPVIVQLANALGMTAALDLTAAGRQGVAVNAVYDLWTPARHYQSYHGGARILSESASARIATPVTLRPDQLSNSAQGYSPRERTWNHIEPWTGGTWRLRDIVDDQLVVMESLCRQAASRREELLTGFHGVLKRASERTAPFAYVIPAEQADPGAARKMLETLAFGAVEVERAAEAFTANGRRYSAGSYVIRMQQPFSAFAKALLEKQAYPDLRMYPGGPPKRPYDVTAHTLPLLMGVEAVEAAAPFSAALEKETKFFERPAGEMLAASDTESWRRAAAAWKASKPVWRNSKTGDFSVAAKKPAGFGAVDKPRIAVYRSHVPVMDEGWTRWILEEFGFEYASVGNTDVKRGRLRERFDTIVFADQSASSIQNGYRQGAMPDEFTGGLGAEGAQALKTFAEQGGRLVFINDSGEYAVEQLGVKLRNALKGVSNREFYCPGSLLNVRVDNGSPLTLGMPREFPVWMEGGPVWEPENGSGAKVVLRYAETQVLASGWLLGEKYLAGKPAVVDAPIGRGRAVLFGLRPQYRGQSYLTLKLLFNALLG
jgi:hypothetical protein